jgi:starch synthase
MRILLASSELHPYSKSGGLADMVASLAKTLAAQGHRVGVVTPLYLGVRERFPGLTRIHLPLDVPLGAQRVRGEVFALEPVTGLTIYFVDQPGFYQRSTLYEQYGVDYPDNAERFIFLSKAAAHLALHLPWKPELLHVNDWQTGLAALLLHHQRKLPGWTDAPRTCLTIHNLAYQGVFAPSAYALTNLPWDYFTPSGIEFYGQICCLKAGIAFADGVTTVSPGYAREITTPEFGCGLDGLLRARNDPVFGILNGADYEEWDPAKDRLIKQNYSTDHLEHKIGNKIELQKQFALPMLEDVPLFGSVGRLVHQKGVDIMLGAMEEMCRADLQFVLLGSGAPLFQRAFQDLAARFSDRVSVLIGFDERLSHLVEAGSDFFLMPSKFEPCGLNQMYSLRYGTIPIVRKTGGLDDSVIDVRENAVNANGIKFAEYSARALAKGVRKALTLYEEPALLHHFRVNGMTADFSWERTAAQYIEVYRKAMKG